MKLVIQRMLCAIPLLLFSFQTNAVDIRFSGFGDVVFGGVSGGPANAEAGQLYEDYGNDPFNLSSHNGATISGIDFVTIVDLNEDFTFLAEVNLQAERGASSELGLDVERIFLNYEFDAWLNIQAGLYFTPIGYHNRFLYSRAWLMNSTQVPDLFEEDLNLVPTHSVGIMAHGTFDLDGGSSIRYAVSIANGRAAVSNAAIYGRDGDNTSKELSGLLEWTIPTFNYSRFGISGWTDQAESVRIDNYGESVTDEFGMPTQFDEVGINPYVVLQGYGFSLLAEYVHSEREDVRGNLGGETWEMDGWSTELSYRAMNGRLHPYIRYDRIKLEEGGDPYLNLREDGGEFTKVYIPDTDAVMVGAAYDVNSNVRLKGEIVRNFDGAREKTAFTLQLAFGF